ncbi:MAG: RnfABCDGE type electron transport complex subunit B [Phycisphaerae bacterium]|jgi:RnfABCDGE-type electron transport complex B subunit|nr:RnfABCDGE type electron transport complex subunit B [Phycisphaerae bacterium]MDP7289332.1 RnfABCDGE type electron transport complex subunit B [Phycisphaerae bacterium]
MMILLAAVTMLVLGMFMAYVLGWANVAFHVDVDPRIEACIEALPGANCGGCGYVGCGEYAEVVVLEGVAVDLCPVGGDACAETMAAILGVEVAQSWPSRPVIHCGASLEDRLGRNEYQGEQVCTAANMVAGVQGCTYGCLGFGDCGAVCNFDAIHVIDGLATVDYDKCVGCGACEKICPRHIISMTPFKLSQMLAVTCANNDFGKDVKGVCKIGCIGCKACGRASKLFSFAEGDSIPSMDYDQYDPAEMEDLDVALNKCPQKRLLMVGNPTEHDLEATEDLEVPTIVKPDFETTVDKTEWHG